MCMIIYIYIYIYMYYIYIYMYYTICYTETSTNNNKHNTRKQQDMLSTYCLQRSSARSSTTWSDMLPCRAPLPFSAAILYHTNQLYDITLCYRI